MEFKLELTVYHLKNCDTCKKAIKALESAGHQLALIDVRADGVPAEVLAEIEKSVGYEALMNTRSTTWRGLDDVDKQDMTREKALKLTGAHSTLIKRPVIVSGSSITVGWTKDVQANWVD